MKGFVRSDVALGCALGLIAFAIAVLTDASVGATYLIAFAVTSVGFVAIMRSEGLGPWRRVRHPKDPPRERGRRR